MSFRQNHSSGNKAVTLLATCLVVLGGALTCAVIVLSTEAERQRSSLLVAGASMAGIIVVLWLLRDRTPENRARAMWSWLGRKRRHKIAYRAEPRLSPAERSLAHPPAPPTADSIRGISAGKNTWVPASTAPPKRPKS